MCQYVACLCLRKCNMHVQTCQEDSRKGWEEGWGETTVELLLVYLTMDVVVVWGWGEDYDDSAPVMVLV